MKRISVLSQLNAFRLSQYFVKKNKIRFRTLRKYFKLNIEKNFLGSLFFKKYTKFEFQHVPALSTQTTLLNLTFFGRRTKTSIFGQGYLYLRGIILILGIDAIVTDDEPLGEPIEGSLVQTGIFFIFFFAGIAENLITSRYGSYTGRDKRVGFAGYKSFGLIELGYLLSFGSAAAFVITPFYYEITYQVAFIVTGGSGYTRIFFFKFISSFSILLLIATFTLLNVRGLYGKKLFLLCTLVTTGLAFLLYFNFVCSFGGYFTDPLGYQKTRFNNYIQLSHEPVKGGWGPAKRDHFTYHKVSTVFGFKNDNPFAGAMLLLHLFLFLTLFFLYLYGLVLLRRVYATNEISITYLTYCVSALRQFLYYFLLLFLLITFSVIINYGRFPLEFLGVLNTNSGTFNFLVILKDYGTLVYA